MWGPLPRVSSTRQMEPQRGARAGDSQPTLKGWASGCSAQQETTASLLDPWGARGFHIRGGWTGPQTFQQIVVPSGKSGKFLRCYALRRERKRGFLFIFFFCSPHPIPIPPTSPSPCFFLFGENKQYRCFLWGWVKQGANMQG